MLVAWCVWLCVPPLAKQPSLMFIDRLRSPRARTYTSRRLLVYARALGLLTECLQPGEPASPNVHKQAPACIRTGSRTPFWMLSAWGAREPERIQAGACLYAFGLSDSVLNAFSLGSPQARTYTSRRLLVYVWALGLLFECLQPGEPTSPNVYKQAPACICSGSRTPSFEENLQTIKNQTKPV